MGDGGVVVVVVVASGLICACACSEEVLSSAAVTEMAEEEESPDGDCDEDETTWPRSEERQNSLSEAASELEAVWRLRWTLS